MNSNAFEIIFQIIIITLSAVGGLSCIYIFGGFIFKNKSNLFIKGNTYLVLDVDEIGEKLEYYVRKIESDIEDNRYIYISKIILYSKILGKPGNENGSAGEIYRICKILTENYNNIIFINDIIIENENNNDNNILSFISIQ